jgi:bifunctional non-homologous end joining protein LigD
VAGHPVTLHRFPDGVRGVHWYETRAPAHPSWVQTVTFDMPRTGKVFEVCVVNDLASLVWAAQMGTVELHPFLGTVGALDRPTAVVFDLDPGPPATVVDCCRVALRLSQVLDGLGLRGFAKTSGGLGLHVCVPLNTPVRYGDSKAFARSVAVLLERDDPALVTSKMARATRPGKVFIDWSQNDPGKSTVAAYSLRGLEYPTVSTPVSWAEVEDTAAADASRLTFLAGDVLARVEEEELFAPVASLRQRLPEAGGADARP